MSKSQSLHKVNIRPSVSVLSVLKHLNYKPWFALAEFVDNAIQSFFNNEKQLRAVAGKNYKLRVEIEINPDAGGQIIVRDNAAGIAFADFPRAFRPADIPPDRSGLCEFGMGMKSAAFWYASKWSVRTSALGESVERQVNLDINSILADKLEDLGVVERPAKPDEHFTELVLTDLHQNPIGRTLGKIQEHLSSIYRVYLRDGKLELVFKGESLSYPTPTILNAPYFKTPAAKAVAWRKEIDFDFGDGLRAHGFAALFEVASTARAGFALFRRNRLIEGSSDEGYRPHAIFGNPNDYTFQRVFGELHLEGFEVSHTKDGFRWHDNEDAFLQLLQEELDKEPLPVLKQAEGHRVRPKAEDFVKGAEKANQRTTETIQKCVPQVIQKQHELGPETKPVPAALPQAQQTASTREIEVDVNGIKWLIRIELSTDTAIGEWLSVTAAWRSQTGDCYDFNKGTERIEVKTTTQKPRKHHFTLDQLNPPTGTRLLVVSIIVQRSGAGQSVFELSAAIRQKTLRQPQVHLRILRQLHDTLGNSWQSARNVRFDYEAAVASLHYYEGDQIPKVALPLPEGVSQVGFVSDFRGLTPASRKSFTNSGALFRTLF